MLRDSVGVRIGFLLVLLVVVGCNKRHVLNCVIEPSTVTEGDTAVFKPQVQDPEKKNMTMRFGYQGTERIQVGSRLKPQDDGTAIFESSGLEPGLYTVGVRVSDNKHDVACTADVTVVKNKIAPEIVCADPSRSITEGGSARVEAKATDANGDALTYSWEVAGQKISNDQPYFEFGSAGRAVGAHTARVTVTDVDGLSASCDFNIAIARRPNTSPTVTLALSKADVFAGESITATAQSKDPEGDPITHTWKIGGTTRSETGTSITINTRGLAGGRHQVSVEAKDDRGGSSNATQSFSVKEKAIILVNATRLDNVAKAQLDEIAVKLQQNPQLRAIATGFTDDRGSEENNMKVGQKRADAVKDYLVKEQQIAESRIQTKSGGESNPVADNTTDEGRKENRRVEVVLYVP
jgi:outer membrane protein OmpA-like peptidoglycan-associated protein